MKVYIRTNYRRGEIALVVDGVVGIVSEWPEDFRLKWDGRDRDIAVEQMHRHAANLQGALNVCGLGSVAIVTAT